MLVGVVAGGDRLLIIFAGLSSGPLEGFMTQEFIKITYIYYVYHQVMYR